MKFQKFEISFLIFGSILVVVFNVILVALKVLVVFEIFKETSNKFAVKFQTITTVQALIIGKSLNLSKLPYSERYGLVEIEKNSLEIIVFEIPLI